MTECAQSSFEFAAHFNKPVVADFAGPITTSDGGGPLMRQTDATIDLMHRFAACFQNHRDARFIRREVAEMVSQRVYGIALGYEDINDHDHLRNNSMLSLLAGKRRNEIPLAGKSTLNRLELGTDQATRYKKIGWNTNAMDELLTSIFIEAHSEPPRRIGLDLDATDLPQHGHQEQRFFRGYYDHYCYLPLHIFYGEHLPCHRIKTPRPGAPARGLGDCVPHPAVVAGGPNYLAWRFGFCREELMKWREDNRVDYVFGFARNTRLERLLALFDGAGAGATERHRQTRASVCGV